MIFEALLRDKLQLLYGEWLRNITILWVYHQSSLFEQSMQYENLLPPYPILEWLTFSHMIYRFSFSTLFFSHSKWNGPFIYIDTYIVLSTLSHGPLKHL